MFSHVPSLVIGVWADCGILVLGTLVFCEEGSWSSVYFLSVVEIGEISYKLRLTR